MLIENRKGESIYLEYMLKLYLDDGEHYFATGEVPNRELVTLMTIPEGSGREVDIVSCSGGSGAITLEIYNNNQVFSQFVATRDLGAGLYKKKCELYLVTAENETLLSTGFFDSFNPLDTLGSKYKIEITDYMSEFLEKETLFYKMVDGFKTYARWWDYIPSLSSADNLLNRPANATGVTVTKVLQPDSTDKFIIKLAGHPLDVGKYLIDEMHNINAKINNESWENAKLNTNIAILNKCVFELENYPDNVMGFLSEKIFRICNVYPYINKNGELCVRRQEPITALQNVNFYTITKDEFIDIEPMEYDYNKVVNHVMVERANENIREYYPFPESIRRFGDRFLPETPPTIELAYGSMSDAEIAAIGDEISYTLFAMFSDVYHEFETKVSLTDFANLEIMDTILIQHDLLLNPDTGGQGFDESQGNEEILYAEMDVDRWSNYTAIFENKSRLDENQDITYYELSNGKITFSWYNSVIDANNDNRIYANKVRG